MFFSVIKCRGYRVSSARALSSISYCNVLAENWLSSGRSLSATEKTVIDNRRLLIKTLSGIQSDANWERDAVDWDTFSQLLKARFERTERKLSELESIIIKAKS